jgi:hypothetical protein
MWLLPEAPLNTEHVSKISSKMIGYWYEAARSPGISIGEAHT